MELTLDGTQAHFLKEWVKEGKTELWISKKLGMSIDKVIFAKRALCPTDQRKTVINVNGKGLGSRSAHGTAGKYNAGCRCTPCTSFNTQRAKDLKAERLTRPQDIPHGTMSGYWNWDCRCDSCKKVGAETQKMRTYTDPLTHTRKGETWIKPEHVATQKYDLTARDIALELGRTIPAVNTQRSLIGRGLVKV